LFLGHAHAVLGAKGDRPLLWVRGPTNRHNLWKSAAAGPGGRSLSFGADHDANRHRPAGLPTADRLTPGRSLPQRGHRGPGRSSSRLPIEVQEVEVDGGATIQEAVNDPHDRLGDVQRFNDNKLLTVQVPGFEGSYVMVIFPFAE
jgi:hypothetical protein